MTSDAIYRYLVLFSGRLLLLHLTTLHLVNRFYHKICAVKKKIILSFIFKKYVEFSTNLVLDIKIKKK